MKIKGIMDLYYEIENLTKLSLVEASKHIDKMEEKYVKLDELIEMLEKLKKILTKNSKCDCTISTDKYAGIIDAFVLFNLKSKVKGEPLPYKGGRPR